jgi:hypothetical protein
VSAGFAPQTREGLLRQGWRLAVAPAGVTLAGLRTAGAPYKGDKYFTQQAQETSELPVQGGEVAYRPGLMPGSLNRPFEAAVRLAEGLKALLPPGAVGKVGPAALYVWLLVDHQRRHGEWLLRQCLTWAADPSGETHLAVGVFGQARPLIVSPVPELTGQGLGLMPLIVPAPAGGAGTGPEGARDVEETTEGGEAIHDR